MKIRFCENNEGCAGVCKRLRVAFPDVDIKRKKCLKKCALCNSSMFALVDGIIVTGRNGEELFLKIVEQIHTG